MIQDQNRVEAHEVVVSHADSSPTTHYVAVVDAKTGLRRHRIDACDLVKRRYGLMTLTQCRLNGTQMVDPLEAM